MRRRLSVTCRRGRAQCIRDVRVLNHRDHSIVTVTTLGRVLLYTSHLRDGGHDAIFRAMSFTGCVNSETTEGRTTLTAYGALKLGWAPLGNTVTLNIAIGLSAAWGVRRTADMCA